MLSQAILMRTLTSTRSTLTMPWKVSMPKIGGWQHVVARDGATIVARTT
jgi:hypothetical protein